jgi:hypothetical protein
MTHQTAPLAHRHPFWMGWHLLRTCDPPLSLLEYLLDHLLYVQLKNPPPVSTATFVIGDSND